jgi:hypothetical protein
MIYFLSVGCPAHILKLTKSGFILTEYSDNQPTFTFKQVVFGDRPHHQIIKSWSFILKNVAFCKYIDNRRKLLLGFEQMVK